MIKAVIFDMFETLITHFHENAEIYFGTQIAEDVGIEWETFIQEWRGSEPDRTLGFTTIDAVVKRVTEEYGCYRKETVDMVMEKRRKIVKSCFSNMHPEILEMIKSLKEHGVKIGLISNCFQEETDAIKESVLYPFFDAACLSCELHMRKPNEDIYLYCVDKLGVKTEECLYVGDGGSQELEIAEKVGMVPRQAAWYLKEGTKQPVGRKEEYNPLDRPMEIVDFLRRNYGI